MSHLIWIDTVCRCVLNFVMPPPIAIMDTSEFKDGRVQFTNIGLKGLKLMLLNYGMVLRGQDPLCFSAVFDKGDIFCGFLLAFLHTKQEQNT